MNFPQTLRLASAEIAGNGVLRLVFQNGETRLLDVKPKMRGIWFGALADPSYFSQLRFFEDGSGIMWPHGQEMFLLEMYKDSIPESSPAEVLS